MDDYFEESPAAETAPVMVKVPSTAELLVMRAAAKDAVERIRLAEDRFYTAQGVYLDCGTEAEARARMSLAKAKFPADGCWTTLGVDLGDLVGGFYVSVDARGYRVHGLLDTDHDGAAATVVATANLPATWSSPVTVR